MSMPFTKMVGAGNDFILIERHNLVADLDVPKVQAICHRRKGIGADQLLVVEKKDGLVEMFVHNADGSVAEQCGNGMRCVAYWYFLQDNILPEIRTKTSKATPNFIDQQTIEVPLGLPTWPDIDLSPLRLPKIIEKVDYLMFGNPHLVVWTKNLKNIGIEGLGSFCEKHPVFPNGTNVHFVEKISKDLVSVRVWERGSGETGSCGSGACAVVASGQKLGHLNESVTLQFKEDTLSVRSDENNVFWLSGPCSIVFQGEVNLET